MQLVSFVIVLYCSAISSLACSCSPPHLIDTAEYQGPDLLQTMDANAGADMATNPPTHPPEPGSCSSPRVTRVPSAPTLHVYHDKVLGADCAARETTAGTRCVPVSTNTSTSPPLRIFAADAAGNEWNVLVAGPAPMTVPAVPAFIALADHDLVADLVMAGTASKTTVVAVTGTGGPVVFERVAGTWVRVDAGMPAGVYASARDLAGTSMTGIWSMDAVDLRGLAPCIPERP